jgi:pSer/pThr/pTyr-binding forkhead associated (FHA) protein
MDTTHRTPGSSAEERGTDSLFGLVFTLESGETRTFDCLPILIGRARHNDIILDDPTVSATHARIYFDDWAGDVCIFDLDSLNGMLIDGNPSRKNILNDGVTIQLGQVSLKFRDTGYIHMV